mmetsp:Transcript_6690/g.9151  ORF Transcript_6690/g.9151 Transcript_6690/m.9151 type:complete len:82 (-) Transcript_6690:1401-1646(-)|eukprot:CAMPEP_0185622324 /NCGR_PEP_ID=MMETSP0436-20130131/59153_1 /TAXON_ID=626734 ORGANISM="Favella taraikaensis, Strain Fe Narragansett Bay" /NCGR_SAMPLE_ID=MMETSP0436 /ASSEMBLY_ACC=CAM_ASM_000390 /LENGTH=81 /DNA_ID=CAMNT_0028264029 /DNA_START=696 /DNA_END=941 /DNA_ORIENTATION=-
MVNPGQKPVDAQKDDETEREESSDEQPNDPAKNVNGVNDDQAQALLNNQANASQNNANAMGLQNPSQGNYNSMQVMNGMQI